MSSNDSTVRTPSQERAVRTRAALVVAAKEEFSTRGYAGTTAKSIAERAGVSTGSFYQYFKDKDQVLYELARERFVRVALEVTEHLALDDLPTRPSKAALREALADRMRRLVHVVIDFHREDPGLHGVLTERRHADPALDTMTSEAEGALVLRIAGMLRGFGQQGDVEALAFALFGMVEGAVHAHVLGRPVLSDERLVEALVEAMVRVSLH